VGAVLSPVIFLDCDGVLNSQRWYDQMGPPPNPPPAWVDPACVARLDALARETGARLVLSSSWRLILDLPRVADILASCGLSVPLADATPDLTREGPEADRWHEIARWLADHPEVTRWAILDDLPLAGVPDGRLVQTDLAVGLTDADCNRVRVALAPPLAEDDVSALRVRRAVRAWLEGSAEGGDP